MLQIPMCPVCKEPVAEQPTQNWTSAYRGGIPWWHLADNTPICQGEDGNLSQAEFIAETVPTDREAITWLDMMADLFAPDGLYSPGRLGSAITAAEHLHQWLHLATGPFSALMALPTPADVAFLVGHLYRTSRLLARVQAQTGSYVADVVRRQPTAGLDDDARHAWAEVRGQAHDIRELLDNAAAITADSARDSAAAWSCARRATTAWATALPEQPPVDDRVPTGQPVDQDAPDASSSAEQELHDGLTHTPLAELIGAAFGDEAGFSPELTHTATLILGTLTNYLSNCLGPARPVAVPTPQHLADLATALTYLTNTFHDSLRQVVEHAAPSDTTGLDEAHVAALHHALAQASEALRRAAQNLALASYHAAGLDPWERP